MLVMYMNDHIACMTSSLGSHSKLTQCQSAKQAADQRVLEMTQELENNAGNVYE